MKDLRLIKKKTKELLDIHNKYLDNMEVEPAPSGEYAEYNYHYMIQEAVVETLEEVYDLFKKEKECL